MTISKAPVPDPLAALRGIGDAVRARGDFGAFCEHVHQRPLYPHQRAWVEKMLAPESRTLIVAPPGSYKSTVCAYLVEWLIGRDPDFTVLYLMNTASQAQRQVAAIEETIEFNEKYRRVFPGVMPDKGRGWSHEALYVVRPDSNNPYATVYGTGIDGPYQGVHVDLIIVDDPTDQKDVYSLATMTQQRDRVKGQMIDRLKPGGSIFAILTRWGVLDLTVDLQAIELRMIENPVEGKYPWGGLLCPELYSRQDIEGLKRTKGEGLFAMTYMCNPSILARQTSFFDVDAMTSMLAEDAREPVSIERGLISIWKKAVVAGKYVLGADTSWGKSGSYSAASVSDWQTGEQMAELHGRPHPDDCAQELFNLHKLYNHAYTGVEIAGEGQERDGEAVVVADKLKALMETCECKGRMLFYADHDKPKPSRPGVQTDGRSRPVMLGELAEAIRNRQAVIHSRPGIGEMMSFLRNDKGRPEAAEGAYDDRVMAYAIMWQMRKWAKFTALTDSRPLYVPSLGGRAS